MGRSDSRREYERRMHAVLDYIDTHLDGTLDLPTTASVAHFSPYHFHRLFAAWMGETPGDYLRRRRLEVAAMRLVMQPASPVLDIALAVGFGSAEAFARVFKARFDVSPTEWRSTQRTLRSEKRNGDQANSKFDQMPQRRRIHHGASCNPESETAMKVTLIDRAAVDVAYLRHLGPYGAPIARFWQERVYPWLAANGLQDRPRYGISHDDPGVTAAGKCRYDACVEVPAELALSGDAFRTRLPGGRYACLGFKGTAADVGEAWSALLRDWLPSSGLQLDARPCFERYPADATFDPRTGVFECEICIPVVPL